MFGQTRGISVEFLKFQLAGLVSVILHFYRCSEGCDQWTSCYIFVLFEVHFGCHVLLGEVCVSVSVCVCICVCVCVCVFKIKGESVLSESVHSVSVSLHVCAF